MYSYQKTRRVVVAVLILDAIQVASLNGVSALSRGPDFGTSKVCLTDKASAVASGALYQQQQQE